MEFPIVSSPSSTVVFAGVIATITIAIGILFLWFAYTASNLSASVEESTLQIDVPIYGRSIPLANLDVACARSVDLEQSPELRPRIRTNGIGLPGYAVGWFKLRNGEKALAALTSRDNVLYIQTTEGYSLLLSVSEPEKNLEHLTRISSNDV
jgi:hypothetical protein